MTTRSTQSIAPRTAARASAGCTGRVDPLRRDTDASELRPTIRRSHSLAAPRRMATWPGCSKSKHPFVNPTESKTGGQTLATRLASAFDLDKVHFMKDQLVFSKDIETLDTLLAEKHFIESHVAGMLLSKRENLPILCTVREPVSQMLSNWRHILREKSNQWHRAAVALRPGEFFDIFGDSFTDHQTTYILSSFVPLHLFIERKGYHRAVYESFLGCVDRIRWLVPTESIDEFVGL